MAPRLVRILAVSLLAGIVMPSPAAADGDPASDTLLSDNVFYAYSSPITPVLQNALNAETGAASRADFTIKVALIASPSDLGVVPNLFGSLQKYADFLYQEISLQATQVLRVVMPSGYGIQGLARSPALTATALTKPAGDRGSDLARAAIAAVSQLAATAVHPVKSGAAGLALTGVAHSPKATASNPLVTLIVAPLAFVAVVTAGGLIALRRRQRRPARSLELSLVRFCRLNPHAS
jgi:hypothetical protein